MTSFNIHILSCRYTTDGGSRQHLERGTIRGSAVFTGKFHNLNIVSHDKLTTIIEITEYKFVDVCSSYFLFVQRIKFVKIQSLNIHFLILSTCS